MIIVKVFYVVIGIGCLGGLRYQGIATWVSIPSICTFDNSMPEWYPLSKSIENWLGLTILLALHAILPMAPESFSMYMVQYTGEKNPIQNHHSRAKYSSSCPVLSPLVLDIQITKFNKLIETRTRKLIYIYIYMFILFLHVSLHHL